MKTLDLKVSDEIRIEEHFEVFAGHIFASEKTAIPSPFQDVFFDTESSWIPMMPRAPSFLFEHYKSAKAAYVYS